MDEDPGTTIIIDDIENGIRKALPFLDAESQRNVKKAEEALLRSGSTCAFLPLLRDRCQFKA